MRTPARLPVDAACQPAIAITVQKVYDFVGEDTAGSSGGGGGGGGADDVYGNIDDSSTLVSG